MAVRQKGQLLDTQTVGAYTLTLYYYPVPKWYEWWCSNGDCGTSFKTEELARADMALEAEWIMAGK